MAIQLANNYLAWKFAEKNCVLRRENIEGTLVIRARLDWSLKKSDGCNETSKDLIIFELLHKMFFDGSHKRKKDISLGGASKQVIILMIF